MGKDTVLVCPECKSHEVTVTSIQRFMANTGDYWCEAIKTGDDDSPARCIECGWEGERKDLNTAPEGGQHE